MKRIQRYVQDDYNFVKLYIYTQLEKKNWEHTHKKVHSHWVVGVSVPCLVISIFWGSINCIIIKNRGY